MTNPPLPSPLSSLGQGSAAGMSVQDQLDVLISRAADGEATAVDWSALNGLADQSPGAWKQLACAQRQHAALSAAMAQAILPVENLGLPDDSQAQCAGAAARADAPVRARPWRAWVGWAVAASVAIAWLSQHRLDVIQQPTSAAGLLPAGWNTERLADEYVERGRKEGRVVGEVPQRVLVSATPAERGDGYDVVYLRQFVERTRVPSLVRFGVDEGGKPVPVQFVVPVRGPADPQ